MNFYHITALCFGAYFFGSIPFGKIIARSYHIDIQKRGSGNIGFANVRRIVGWRAGIITLAADITKGFVPTFISLQLFGPTIAFLIGVIAIVGHVFPVWLKFHGGKGIATGLGVIFALQPIAGMIGAVIYIASCLITKTSSYSSMIGLITMASVGIIMSPSSWWQHATLFFIALWTLRHNLTGRVPNYDI